MRLTFYPTVRQIRVAPIQGLTATDLADRLDGPTSVTTGDLIFCPFFGPFCGPFFWNPTCCPNGFLVFEFLFPSFTYFCVISHKNMTKLVNIPPMITNHPVITHPNSRGDPSQSGQT